MISLPGPATTLSKSLLTGDPIDGETNDLTGVDDLPVSDIWSNSNGSKRKEYIELLKNTLLTQRKDDIDTDIDIERGQTLPLTAENLHAHNKATHKATQALREVRDIVALPKQAYHVLDSRRSEENELGEVQENKQEEISCKNTAGHLCCRMVVVALVVTLIAGLVFLIIQETKKITNSGQYPSPPVLI